MCLFKCLTGLVSENPLAVNALISQESLDAGPGAIQQTVFQGIAGGAKKWKIKKKKNSLRILQRNSKSFVNI